MQERENSKNHFLIPGKTYWIFIKAPNQFFTEISQYSTGIKRIRLNRIFNKSITADYISVLKRKNMRNKKIIEEINVVSLKVIVLKIDPLPVQRKTFFNFFASGLFLAKFVINFFIKNHFPVKILPMKQF